MVTDLSAGLRFGCIDQKPQITAWLDTQEDIASLSRPKFYDIIRLLFYQ